MAVAFNDAIAGVVTGLTLDPESQAEAVKQLAEIIDEAEGERAQAVGAAIRDFGCLAPLIEMLSREETQQDALRVIGNLASEAVDARAEETKTLLRELNGFDAVLPLIFSSSEPTLVYALGAVQNLCTRPEYAEHVRATGADAKLRVLETQGRTDILRHFAAGCLANMRAVEAPAYVLPAIGEASASEENGSDDSGEAGHASRAGSSRRSSGAPSPHSRPTAPVPAPPARAVATAGALIRKLVPPDNHCLFTACAYLCEGITRPDALRVAAQRLRGVCARAVEEAADRADRLALLGFESAEAYSEWIRDEGHWGGEPELVALAAHFGVEIVVASCQSLSLLKCAGPRPPAPNASCRPAARPCWARAAPAHGGPSRAGTATPLPRAPSTCCTRGSTTTRSRPRPPPRPAGRAAGRVAGRAAARLSPRATSASSRWPPTSHRSRGSRGSGRRSTLRASTTSARRGRPRCGARRRGCCRRT